MTVIFNMAMKYLNSEISHSKKNCYIDWFAQKIERLEFPLNTDLKIEIFYSSDD